MTRLRVACVGTGFIAGRHLAALAGFRDVDVVAVADPVPERAAAAAERCAARAYPDGLALLAAEDLDAVWLCVPPYAHGPLESAAIDRGLPFFVEKPLALDLATAVQIGERVRDAGLLTAVGYHWRHLDLLDHVLAALRDRPARLITGYWLDRTPAAPWWSQRNRSGGQVLEQTTHLFDLARLLVGEVETVHAREVPAPLGAQGTGSAQAPVASSVLLGFASGAVGVISSARMLEWRHRVGLHLLGDGQAVELTERALSDHELRVRAADGERVLQSDDDPVAREDREFLDAVRGQRQQVRVPYAEALRSHAVAWAADRSAQQNAPVRLADVLPSQLSAAAAADA